MASFALFNAGGMVFRFVPADGFSLCSISTARYAPFISKTVRSLDPSPIQILLNRLDGSSLSDAGYECVWKHKSVTRIYRRGSHFLLKTFRQTEPKDELEWLTHCDTVTGRIEAYTSHVPHEDNQAILPNIDQYPHIRFLLLWQLAARNGMWLHSAGAKRGNKIYLFTGRSGIGKSTLAKLLHNSGLFHISSDENNILRNTDDGFHAYGTPWQSRACLSDNISAPLGGIFFLKQAPQNAINPISTQEALKRILPQIHISWFDQAMSDHVLRNVESLVENTSCWSLAFRPDAEVVECLVNMLDRREASCAN